MKNEGKKGRKRRVQIGEGGRKEGKEGRGRRKEGRKEGLPRAPGGSWSPPTTGGSDFPGVGKRMPASLPAAGS